MLSMRVFVRHLKWKFEVGKDFSFSREKAEAVCVEEAYKVAGGSDRWKLCKNDFSTLESMLSLKEMYFQAFQRNPSWWMASIAFTAPLATYVFILSGYSIFSSPFFSNAEQIMNKRASIQSAQKEISEYFFSISKDKLGKKKFWIGKPLL